MISLTAHNILDYAIGITLIASPSFFEFNEVDSARSVFLILGFGLICYSILTNYHSSFFKLIAVRAHFRLDLLAGLTLIAAPFLFGYVGDLSGGQVAVHFLVGGGIVSLVALTGKVHPATRTSNGRNHLRRVS